MFMLNDIFNDIDIASVGASTVFDDNLINAIAEIDLDYGGLEQDSNLSSDGDDDSAEMSDIEEMETDSDNDS